MLILVESWDWQFMTVKHGLFELALEILPNKLFMDGINKSKTHLKECLNLIKFSVMVDFGQVLI